MRISLIAVFLSSYLALGNSFAQEYYPAKPLTVVVAMGSGAMDTIARTICKAAEKHFGQPIMVENRPGGGGALGIAYALRSKPDGYTIGITGTANLIVTPHLENLPYNVLTDITDILPIAKYNFLLAVNADSPWKTFDDLLAFAKKNPGKFSFANPGVTATSSIAMNVISVREKIKWNSVPFKGGGEAVAAVLGGHTQGVVLSALETSPHIRAGKLRPLLILSDSRLPEYPHVPTVLDKGYDHAAIAYISFYGAKGLPESIRQKLEEAFKKAMADPSYIELTQKYQFEVPKFRGGKEYTEYWKPRFDEMGKVIKTLGITGK